MIYAHPRWIEKQGIWAVSVFAAMHRLVVVQSANQKFIKLMERKNA